MGTWPPQIRIQSMNSDVAVESWSPFVGAAMKSYRLDPISSLGFSVLLQQKEENSWASLLTSELCRVLTIPLKVGGYRRDLAVLVVQVDADTNVRVALA
jgi:hypothetical protein